MAETVANILTSAAEQLKAAGIDNDRLDARLLFALAANTSSDHVLLHASRDVTAAEKESFESFIRRRIDGEPVSRIKGVREFWGQTFKLSHATLDPRPDSETLISAIKAMVGEWAEPPRSFLDLGTGTGCLLLSLLSEFPQASGLGVDIAPQAVQTAEGNAQSLGMAGRAAFKVSDWLSAVDGVFDVIVCNPPYVRTGDLDSLQPEVRLFDPIEALDGGADGLSCYRLLLRTCGEHLRAGGLMVLETGDGLESEIKAMIRMNGFERIEEHQDLAGHVRCLSFFNS